MVGVPGHDPETSISSELRIANVIWNLPHRLRHCYCRTDLRCESDARAGTLDCGGRAGVGGSRNPDGGESHSSERLCQLKRAGKAKDSISPAEVTQQGDIHHEIELDVRTSVGDRFHHPRFGTNRNLRRKRPTPDAL